MKEALGEVVKYVPQLRERIGWRLFPRTICEQPEAKGARDAIHISTTVQLSLSGRLRALVSGRLLIETRTVTEFKIGRILTHSACSVLPPRFLERDGGRAA